MYIELVVGISVVIQLLTVFFALRLIKTTGGRISWILISLSIFLMGIRRIISLVPFIPGDQSNLPNMTFELIGLITSLLMLTGVVLISPLFRAIKQRGEEMKVLSITDELTGLYNRRGFFALAEHELKMAYRLKTGMFIVYVDLDGLKVINDTMGHQEGDRVLGEVARILRKTFRNSDIIARIGGDEFVVIPTVADGGNIERVTSRLQKKIEFSNTRIGRSYDLSLSVGLACYDPEYPCSLDELLSQEDKAMYEQKRVKS